MWPHPQHTVKTMTHRPWKNIYPPTTTTDGRLSTTNLNNETAKPTQHYTNHPMRCIPPNEKNGIYHHEGVICNFCSEKNFQGNRFKCLLCYNYDLCSTCHGSSKTPTQTTGLRTPLTQLQQEEITR